MSGFINDDTALGDLCDQLSERDWIALDTEFIRERTYHPKLCLIQVADHDGLVACIDPLGIDDLSPLLDQLWRQDAMKVLHAGSQDLELMYALKRTLPPATFDTQVAAALTGVDDQTGYAALVESRLGVKLDKAHTRTDWSRRPLSAPELEYAEDDVRHLPALYDALLEDLERRGRVGWAVEESAVLADPARYEVRPDEAWKRVKGVRDLDAPGFPALRALAAWRERTAMERDRPRQWILRDESLVTLAKIRPSDTATIATIDGLPDSIARRYAEELVAALANLPEDDGSQARLPRALERVERDRVDRMMRRIRELSIELHIAPAMLATRRDCEALARGDRDLSMLSGWRRSLFGEELLALSDA